MVTRTEDLLDEGAAPYQLCSISLVQVFALVTSQKRFVLINAMYSFFFFFQSSFSMVLFYVLDFTCALITRIENTGAQMRSNHTSTKITVSQNESL